METMITTYNIDGSENIPLRLCEGPPQVVEGGPDVPRIIQIGYSDVDDAIAKGKFASTSEEARIAAKKELIESLHQLMDIFDAPGFPYGLKDVQVAYPACFGASVIQEFRNILKDVNNEVLFYHGSNQLCNPE
jgi:hypothetical protein